jgi:hypothetical protein
MNFYLTSDFYNPLQIINTNDKISRSKLCEQQV